MKLNFSSIGNEFCVRVKLDVLSGRDKVELFRALMDDLGITEKFHEAPDETAVAQEIITEQWNQAWGSND